MIPVHGGRMKSSQLISYSQFDDIAAKKIGFYVYNKDTPDKVFDMSVAEKVLLPQSSANFQTVLVAEGGDFTFKLDFSGSYLGKAVMVALAAMMALVNFF